MARQSNRQISQSIHLATPTGIHSSPFPAFVRLPTRDGRRPRSSAATPTSLSALTTMSPIRDADQAFTKYGWTVCAWILLGPFQYGWHISVLNQIQAVLTCASGAPSHSEITGLPTCLPMNDAAFSAVTSILCFGGLVGSLLSDAAMDQWGRRGATRASAVMFAVGSVMMGLAPSFEFLMFGRCI